MLLKVNNINLFIFFNYFIGNNIFCIIIETDAIETESAGSRADQFMTPEEEAAFEKLEDFDYLERKRSAENTESVIRRASEKIHR